jgi:hypothetical protein
MVGVDTSPQTERSAQSPHPARYFVAALAPPLLLVLGMAVATHSVVRYEPRIVAAYAGLAVLLAFWVAQRPERISASAEAIGGHPRALGWGIAVTFGLVAAMQIKGRPFSYLSPADGWLIRGIFATSAVLVAICVLTSALTNRRRVADLGLVVAVLGYLVAAVLLIHLDPRPKIDVWVMLNQAADATRHGANIYTQTWTGSPGVQNAFTYLPFMAVLLAPGRWLAGDVRWSLVAVTLLGVLAVRLLAATPASGRRLGSQTPGGTTPSTAIFSTRLAAIGAAALLLLLPGTPTQVEQAWTEPLLMACLAGWALGVQRRNPVLAVVCLALGLASKQHLFVLLPVLAAWPRFGPRKALLAAGLAGVLMLPWIIASPADMWHDSVSVLINFQPLIFADTLYIAAINSLHWTPPFWLTGAAVLITLAAAMVTVRRRNPDLAAVLRWGALLLFVANLVNKQAFYNQYWLVAALVVISFAVSPALSARRPATAEA